MKKINIIIICICTIICVNHVFDRKNEKTVDVFNQTENKKVLIIDAGHGGLDGGAVGVSGVTEQDITLNISRKADLICKFIGINSKLTRTDESSLDFNENASIRENKVADTRARVEVINNEKDAILVSVHLNSFTDEKYKGAQVFYNEFDEAMNFSNSLQLEIRNKLDEENKREALVAPEEVYLIKNSNFPAIIFECGFLSNANEEKKLCEVEYQTKLAICLISSYLKL